MEVKTARDASVFHRLNVLPAKNQVCRFWLQGRCNRNPCKFMHRESPPPQTEQPSFAPPHDIRQKQPRSMIWKNPVSKKKGHVDQSTLEKALKNYRKSSLTEQVSHTQAQLKVEKNLVSKKGHVDQSTVLKNSRKSSLTEQVNQTQAQLKVEKSSQLLQCKDWVTGDCVHGDKCKHLHSWFCGSGFTMLAKLEGHKEAVTGISLPSASNKLFSGGKDRMVRAWDCSSGQCAASVVTDSEVGCLVSEGPLLFVGLQNAVKAWNLENNTEFSLNAPCGLVCSMVVNDDKLIAGMEDGSILVWKQNPETKIPEPAAMVREHNGAICSLVIGANRLYSGSKDCTIKAWDLQNMQCLQTLTGHTNTVKSVLCWESYLMSASLDNTLKVWATTESGTIEVVHEIKEDHGVITLCGIHDAEARPILLCSFGDNTVRLYDLPTFTEKGIIFSKREVELIKIGIEGLFFTGDATGEISVWKLL
ncbi:hypothetical protein ACS0TY_019508 [Phlomoides rotata]